MAEFKGGGKWQDVVKKYSDDPSASSFGDLGFFKDGTLAPNIATAVAKLDTGDVSDIVKTKYGSMIFKVEERRTPGIPKFDEVEQQVDEILYNQKLQGSLREYLAQLRSESYIYLAPGYVDTGSGPVETAAARKSE